MLTVGKEIGMCLGVRELEVGAPGRRWEKRTKREETGAFDASASWHLRQDRVFQTRVTEPLRREWDRAQLAFKFS